MALRALVVRGRWCPSADQRHTRTRCHGGGRSHAITSVDELGCVRSSTSRRARSCAHAAPQAHPHAISPPRPAQDGGAATRDDAPLAGQVPFFSCVDHRGGADMQHARGIANAPGVHGPIDALLFDLRRLIGVALRQQKGPSTPLAARPAPRALLAFR